MSKNLLRTDITGISRIPGKYIDNESDSTIICSTACEYNRMVYIAALMVVNSVKVLRLMSFNLLTSEHKLIKDINKSSITTSTDEYGFRSILVDDDYFYLMYYSSYDMVRINRSNFNVIKTTFDVRNTVSGKLLWLNSNKILCTLLDGLYAYNTKTDTLQRLSTNPSSSSYDVAIGKKLIITTDWVDSGKIRIHDMNNGYASVDKDYPVSGMKQCSVCYGDGKFFFANQTYLFILDEETQEWADPIAVGFGKSIIWSDYAAGAAFFMLKGSSKFYVYDNALNMFYYSYLPWTLPDTTGIYNSGAVFKQFVLFQWITLGIISFNEIVKYNVGYIDTQANIAFVDEYKNQFTYNQDEMQFNESFLYVKDTKKSFTLVPTTTENIQHVIIDLDNYPKINKVNIVKKEV